jgi:NAD+ kinase
MTIRTVLVVAKKTALERYTQDRPDPKFRRLVEAGDPAVARAQRSHEAHRRALDQVCAELDARRLRWRMVYASTKRSAAGTDLVIAVGGDGTLLDASHGVVDQPVLLVNSFPQTSVGWFAGATVETFPERLDRILAGAVEPLRLNRIAVAVDGRELHHPALNDILLAHENPAATSRYVIRVDGEEEEHVSSGVWVSTAAGSTAAIQAAGGVRQPVRSHDLQYLVREMYRAPGSSLHLTGGIVSDAIEFESRMYEGAVFLDGHRLRHRVGYGDRIVLRAHVHPLRLFVFDRRVRAEGNGDTATRGKV